MTSMPPPRDRNALTERSIQPISRHSLHTMIDACDPHTLAGTRDQLLLAYAWHTHATRGSLVTARIETVPLDRLDAPARGLLTDWLLALAIELRHPVIAGPLFRPVTRYGHLGHRPSLSGEGVNHIVHSAVRRAGLPNPDRYSTLSLRHGGRLGL
jgi:integrase